MNIKDAIKKCNEDANFSSCEECGVFGDSECIEYLSKFLLDKCESCTNDTYYYVDDCGEMMKTKVRFCPECGRSLL